MVRGIVFAQESGLTSEPTLVTDTNTVSLDFKDAGLKDVLKVFSQQSGLNFIAAKSVEDRTITLYMENVVVEDALQTLLDANNLSLEQRPQSNIIVIKGQPIPEVETMTRVYKLRYLHSHADQGEYVIKGKSSGKGKAAGLQVSDLIRPLLSQFGKSVEFMNLVIITDIPERFKLIDQVIADLDKPIPELMLEVELIETTADFLEQMGVNWGTDFLRYTGPARVTAAPYAPWRTNPASSPLEGKLGGSATDTGVSFAYGLMDSRGLNAVLQMLSSDANTKFLAKPRILVQNREWAEIKITADQIVSLQTIVSRSGSTVSTETKVERMEVGTTLRLIPIINEEEGFVSLLLEPTVSRPKDSAFKSPEGVAYVDPLERSFRTVVMIRDGETVAVGGFITTEDMAIQTKVPWFGDIPFLGALFRHKKTIKVDKELLIFITPKILSPTKRLSMSIAEEKAEKEELSSNKMQPEPEGKVTEQPLEEKAEPVADAEKTVLPLREQ
ncbi:MAG: hypothetical protein KKE11_04150 [Gammaproteobacteria bacterium]|nr:hypothetical protein [Gammaproteobacteria bacterium]